MPNRPPSHKPNRPKQPEARPSAAKRGYDRQWRKARAAWLKGKACVDCEAQGWLEPATEPHHLEKHHGDRAKVMDLDGCIPLCKRHHTLRTMRGE